MKPGTTARILGLCAFLSAAFPADATPFSVISPASAEQGTAITVSLFDDNVTHLEAADLVLNFDSIVFQYLGSTVGSATSGFSLIANPVLVGGNPLQVEISLGTGGDPVDGISGSLVAVSFLIKQNAPVGNSDLVFEAKPLSDYHILRTLGRVNVTPTQSPVPVSAPASSMLIGMGMIALVTFRRQLFRTNVRLGATG